jgi:hypothetical protein
MALVYSPKRGRVELGLRPGGTECEGRGIDSAYEQRRESPEMMISQGLEICWTATLPNHVFGLQMFDSLLPFPKA